MHHAKRIACVVTLAASVGLSIGQSIAGRPPTTGTARSFCDTLPSFVVLTPALKKHSQRLKLEMRLRNQSDSEVIFSYYGDFFQHITIYDARHRKVFHRLEAPFLESTVRSVRLRPKQDFRTTIVLDVERFYDLPIGKYYLEFSYDLRLIDNDKRLRKYAELYRSRDFVRWDLSDYPFSIGN